MTADRKQDSIPRPVLIGAGVLVSGAIALAALSQFSGIGHVGLPPATPLDSVSLRFEDRQDGAVTVYRARGNEIVAVLAPETNGFIRGVMRGLARSRKLQGIGAEAPFTLARWDDGRLSLLDKTTGNEVELTAFGATNTAAFAQLLSQPGRTTQVAR